MLDGRFDGLIHFSLCYNSFPLSFGRSVLAVFYTHIAHIHVTLPPFFFFPKGFSSFLWSSLTLSLSSSKTFFFSGKLVSAFLFYSYIHTHVQYYSYCDSLLFFLSFSLLFYYIDIDSLTLGFDDEFLLVFVPCLYPPSDFHFSLSLPFLFRSL